MQLIRVVQTPYQAPNANVNRRSPGRPCVMVPIWTVGAPRTRRGPPRPSQPHWRSCHPLRVPRKGRMLHSCCFPEHCRTSPGSPPRPRATALTKVFFASWHTRPAAASRDVTPSLRYKGDRWTSPRRPSSSHRRVRRRPRNTSPSTRPSMRRRNRVGISRSRARRSGPTH